MIEGVILRLIGWYIETCLSTLCRAILPTFVFAIVSKKEFKRLTRDFTCRRYRVINTSKASRRTYLIALSLVAR